MEWMINEWNEWMSGKRNNFGWQVNCKNERNENAECSEFLKKRSQQAQRQPAIHLISFWNSMNGRRPASARVSIFILWSWVERNASGSSASNGAEMNGVNGVGYMIACCPSLSLHSFIFCCWRSPNEIKIMEWISQMNSVILIEWVASERSAWNESEVESASIGYMVALVSSSCTPWFNLIVAAQPWNNLNEWVEWKWAQPIYNSIIYSLHFSPTHSFMLSIYFLKL